MSSKRLWEILENKRNDKTSQIFNGSILFLITLNIVAVILESVPSIKLEYNKIFFVFELISIIIFSIEYITRVSFCTQDKEYKRPITGRLKYAITPMALIDLFTILPFFFIFLPINLRFIRIFRLFRVFRIIKSIRYLKVLKLFKQLFKAQSEELTLAFFAMVMMLIISSCLLYYAEPENFISIPDAMWWAIATLTTVGYGDIVPITAFGKLLAAIVAILGIAFFALPAGIISSGLTEQLGKNKATNKCPHCNKILTL